MKSKVIFLLVFLFASGAVFAQSPFITNTHNRDVKTLNGKWKYIIDMYETGYYDYRYKAFDESENIDPAYSAFYSNHKPRNKSERVEYDFDLSPSINVPGDWNSQDDKLLYYEGTIWYKRDFNYTKKKNSNRVFVYFGGANYETDVYLNGKKLGKHIGGFTPFSYEVTDLLNEEGNFLILKVDNKRKREAVPTLNTDWWNYGGITRDVKLVEVPSTFIKDYTVQLKEGEDDVLEGMVEMDGKELSGEVEISIPEIEKSFEVKINNKGFGYFEENVKGLKYWSPKNPKLYNVELRYNNNVLNDQIGFRTIETEGTEILLNGEPVFLRGICIHEDNPLRGGRAFSKEDAKVMLGWAKELNCNFVRLAHYPHNENMIRMAEKMGIMVWEENPVYWTILWENEETFNNAKNQLKEVIYRDKNRANVIIWSMANETPHSEARNQFLFKLADYAKSIDSTRLISAAMEKIAKPGDPLTQVVKDPFAKKSDIVSFNQYVGWYDGLPEKCNKVEWEIPYEKPVLISEFGGGALAGYHADKLTIWSEEFQEDLYIQSLKMLNKIPQLRAMTPWILSDFRSPRRTLPHIQGGWNRKGLISETGNKKKAFYILKEYYEKKEKEYENK